MDVYDVHYFSGIHMFFGECGTLPVEEMHCLCSIEIFTRSSNNYMRQRDGVFLIDYAPHTLFSRNPMFFVARGTHPVRHLASTALKCLHNRVRIVCATETWCLSLESGPHKLF